MTPSDVSAYLKALRDGGAMSAELKLPTGEIRVVFAPEMPPLELPPPNGEVAHGWNEWPGDAE